MTEPSESRAETLMRQSEIYRRLRSDPPAAVPVPAPAAVAPVAPPGHTPPPPLPRPPRDRGFLRRMLTLRPDGREIALVCIVLVVMLAL